MRHVTWYVVFSLVVGAILAATLPVLVPWYAAIAIIGGLMLLGDLARGQGPARQGQQPTKRVDPATQHMFDQYIDRLAAKEREAAARVNATHQEPWFVDAAVDMDEVAKRKQLEEGPFAVDPGAMVPNPYFVLPLDKLPIWGFATRVEIREALRWANSATPPVRWQNPPLRRLLNQMGWSDTEAYARIGLFFWHTDSPTPDPRTASIEADMRRQNLVYDVPPPASLG
jgi:hypothetical protein